jgi:lactoylglutathione lyase
VKDPKRSIAFYEFLGMKLLERIEQKEASFDLYFLGYDSASAESGGKARSDREGLIELTHNYGTETDENYKITNGNTEPHRGFGHTCISVDNIQAACQRLEDAGCTFQKKLSDGRMRSIAFALDPDGYWVELIGQKPVAETESVKTTDTQTYRMNHTMIRIKDPERSLKFYQEVMGMAILRTSESKEASFTNFFLGYPRSRGVPTTSDATNPCAVREGLLELTWNHGTEEQEGQVYHNGNDEPQGFGHICMSLLTPLSRADISGISVDNLDAACERFDDLKVNWKKRLTDGRMKSVAFVLDPDNYWVEVIQNMALRPKSES